MNLMLEGVDEIVSANARYPFPYGFPITVLYEFYVLNVHVTSYSLMWSF